MSRYIGVMDPGKWRVTGLRAAILAAVAVFAALLVWLFGFRSSMSGDTPPLENERRSVGGAAISVRTVRASMSDSPRWMVATGTARPQLEATVATRVTGRVMAVLAREGERVSKGQPLIRMDARDLDASIAQAGANVRAAAVGVESAQVTAEMEEARSRARIAEAEAGVGQADAAVENARARLELVKNGPRRQERAQASLATVQAKSNFQLAEIELRRMENLVREGVISRQKFDAAKTQYEVAKAQYDAAQQAESLTAEGSRAEEVRAAEEGLRQAAASRDQAAAALKQARAAAMEGKVRRQQVKGAWAQLGQSSAAMQSARVARDYATVRAPFDGVVAERLVDPGALAAPGVPLMRIQGGAMRLEAVVPESAMRAAGTGTAVSVELDALGGPSLSGRVVEVAPQGDPASHTFRVKVALPEGSGVKAGMFGRARLRTGTDRALRIPSEAVFAREGLHYVWTVGADGAARLRLVTTGEEDGARRTILSGLREGERVIVEGRERLSDGARVRER